MNLSQILNDLNGKPLELDKEKLTLGKTIAKILTTSKSPDPLRSYTLAMKINEVKELDLNQSDTDFIEEAVKGDDGFFPLVKGQVLLLLKKVK